MNNTMQTLVSRLILISVVTFVIACSTASKDQNTGADSLHQSEPQATDVLQNEISSEEDTASINDEDYGDPGLAGLILSEEEISEEEREFLAAVTLKGLQPMAERSLPIVVIRPGPGIYPVFDLVGQNGLTEISSLSILFSDSSLISTLTRYRFSPDKCTVLDGFPDGIYIDDFDFKDAGLDQMDTGGNERIQKALQSLASKSGVEFLVKFTSSDNTQVFIHFLTFREDGKLVLGILDQRDCSA